ncbi:MAG: GNAT family N-acetyltransferase [Cognaticolwellia sp.]
MSVSVITADYHNKQQADDVMTCLSAYALDPMGGGEALSEFVESNLIQRLQQQNNIFSVLCYVDGKVAALANCVEGFSTFSAKPLINFHDIVVLKAFRGQGLTQYLFDHVEKIARENGCCKLTLEVLEGNIVAKNAYQKVGFGSYELDPKMGQAVFWQKKL